MACDRPGYWPRHPDNSAQAGMGVDKAAGMVSNHEMKLRRSWLDQQDVVGLNRSNYFPEAIGRCKCQVVPDITVAQSVSARNRGDPANCSQSACDQPDTV